MYALTLSQKVQKILHSFSQKEKEGGKKGMEEHLALIENPTDRKAISRASRKHRESYTTYTTPIMRYLHYSVDTKNPPFCNFCITPCGSYRAATDLKKARLWPPYPASGFWAGAALLTYR